MYIIALIIVRKGSSYGSGSGLIFEIECSEDGRNTTDCSYESVGNISNCTHSNDAGVICIRMSLFIYLDVVI